MKNVETPNKIRFRFKKDDNYRIVPVNGIWGGPTPRGDIRVDFFHESQSLPEVVEHEMTPEGTLGKELGQRSPEIQRTVSVGIILTVEQADSIGRWLQKKALDVRKQRAMGGGDSEHDTPTH